VSTDPGPLSRRAALRLGTGSLVAALTAPASVVAGQDVPNQLLTISVDKNVPYGEAGGIELLLDVYRPREREDSRPAMLLFHAGGMTFGSRHMMADPATKLAEAGYVAFAVAYRLYSPVNEANPWPAQIDDAQRAVRWVRANATTYRVDPERIASYGHSAGRSSRRCWACVRHVTTATRRWPGYRAGSPALWLWQGRRIS
jgi:acetyl esterase/lipase